MSAPMLQNVEIALIDEGDRIRRVDGKAATKLSLSMMEGGKQSLINPILVRPVGERYQLVAGAHRLEAAKLLSWTTIPCLIEKLSDDDAILREVDDNLYRSDLTASDLTFFMQKRLQLFIFKGGILSRGKGLGKSANLADLTISGDADLFYDQVRMKFGIPRRTAERLVKRGRGIPDALWPIIKSAKKPVTGALLDAIVALNPEQRQDVTSLVLNEKLKLSDAIKSVRASEKNDAHLVVEKAVKKIAPSWARWTVKERAEFVRLLKSTGDADER